MIINGLNRDIRWVCYIFLSDVKTKIVLNLKEKKNLKTYLCFNQLKTSIIRIWHFEQDLLKVRNCIFLHSFEHYPIHFFIFLLPH